MRKVTGVALVLIGAVLVAAFALMEAARFDRFLWGAAPELVLAQVALPVGFAVLLWDAAMHRVTEVHTRWKEARERMDALRADAEVLDESDEDEGVYW